MFSRFRCAVPPVYSGISKKQYITLPLVYPSCTGMAAENVAIFCVTHPKRSGFETQQITFHHELAPPRRACCLEANNLRY